MFRSVPRAPHVVFACVLLALAVPSWSSDAVHKCRDKHGQAYYQGSPCPATQQTEWVRTYPDTPSTVKAPLPTVAPAQTDGRDGARRRASGRARAPRRAGSAQGAVISMYRDPVACERARKARDQAYARLGLKRDFATSRRLDDKVNEACR